LQIRSELEIALNQVRTVKKLIRTDASVYGINIPNAGLEFSKIVPSIIFSLNAKQKIIDTAKEIIKYYIDTKTPIEEQFDLIVINNAGIIINQKFPKQYRDYDSPAYGYFYENWNDLTIAAFLMYLDSIPQAVMRRERGIFDKYLVNIKFNGGFSISTETFWEYKINK